MASKMSSFSSSTPLLPVFLFLLYPLIPCEGYGSYQTADIISTEPSAVNCSSSNSGAGKISLGLYHPYGPCARPLQTYKWPSLQEVRMHDKLRIQALMKKKQGSEEGTITGRAALEIEIPNRMMETAYRYVVEIGLGTPMVNQLLGFDTGSRLTWVQCSPCLRCDSQQVDPVFASANSSTYRSLPCNASLCAPSDCSTAGTCLYNIHYDDHSSSAGELATDTLTFAAGGTSFKGFVFGCGTNLSVSNKGASGMLGLSRDPLSIVNQTFPSFAGVFSYCLPASTQATGHLTFGASGNISYVYVPILTSPTRPDLYHVNLTGISIGGTALPIQEAEFLTPQGTIIDSGTTLTYIPQSAYKLVRETFVAQVSKLNSGVLPTINQDGTVCYNSTDISQMTIPSITLQISQVSVPLSREGIFKQMDNAPYCLAFQANESPNDDAIIIGNINQRRLEVVYDIANERIGFAKGTC